MPAQYVYMGELMHKHCGANPGSDRDQKEKAMSTQMEIRCSAVRWAGIGMLVVLTYAAILWTGARADRHVTALTPPTSFQIGAPLRVDAPAKPGAVTVKNVPDGACHEDDPCWNCSTMGNGVCGRKADSDAHALELMKLLEPTCIARHEAVQAWSEQVFGVPHGWKVRVECVHATLPDVP